MVETGEVFAVSRNITVHDTIFVFCRRRLEECSCRLHIITSQYGLPPRPFNSPLHFLILLKPFLEMISSDALFDDPVLKSWIRAKMMMNCPFVLIWFMFGFLFIGLIFSAYLESSWPSVVTNASTDGNNIEKVITCSSQKLDKCSCQWYILTFVSTLILVYGGYSFLIHKWHHPAMTKLIKRRELSLILCFPCDTFWCLILALCD